MINFFRKKVLKGSENLFKKNRYYLARGLVSDELLSYIQDSWKGYDRYPFDSIFIKNKGIHKENSKWNEDFETVECGAAPFGAMLLTKLQKDIEKLINIKLIPTYNYSRKYLRHSVLYAHRDRPSCEISATICIDQKTDNKKPWPIWLKNDKNYADQSYAGAYDISQRLEDIDRKSSGCKKLLMEPGDVLIYQGINVLHWRDQLEGDFSKNVFIHYVNKNGPLYKEHPELEWDGRESAYSDYDINFKNYKLVQDLNIRSEDDSSWLKSKACRGITPID
jgi:hypothetical protein